MQALYFRGVGLDLKHAMVSLYEQPHTFGMAQLILAALTISFVPLLVRSSELHGLSSATARLILAAPVFWLLWAKIENGPRKSEKHDRSSWIWLVAAGVFMAANLGFFHLAIESTSVANAVLLNNCAPLFLALLTWLRGENLSSGFIVSLLVAMLGITLLLGDRPAISDSPWYGNVLGALAGLSLALYLWTMERACRRHGTFLSMAVAASIAIPLLSLGVLALGLESWALPGPYGLASLATLGLICHVGGQGLIAHALRSVPARFCAIALLLQPIGATMLAWIVVGETQTQNQIIGLILVLLGIYTAQKETGHR